MHNDTCGTPRWPKSQREEQLEREVKKVTLGAVNSEVIIELPGGLEIASIITKQSAESLGLSVGKTAHTMIKATDVMVGSD
jgi:molybdopterin-binding protein